MPHLTTADWPTLKAWAQIEYLADQVYAELRRNGVFTREMESRRLLDDFRKLRMAQLPYANALGLTPTNRQAIIASGTTAALDLAAFRADDDDPALWPSDARQNRRLWLLTAMAKRDPLGSAQCTLGVELWDKQQAILHAVTSKRGVAVRSCHSAGKTFLAAVLALY